MKIVVDAFAWIEIFIGSKEGETVRQTIEQADEVFTPDTVVAEVARKYHREGIDEQTIRSRLEAITAASNIISIDLELALKAAKSYVELSQKAKNTRLSTPSLFDAITLAAARQLKAKVITGDEHFKNLPETIWIQ